MPPVSAVAPASPVAGVAVGAAIDSTVAVGAVAVGAVGEVAVAVPP